MRPTRMRRIARLVVIVLPIFLIVFAGLVWAVQSLWNGLMPAIFGLRTIGYWQALGLMVLCWILFGGLRGARSSGGRWRHGMRERWERMTPGEREEFVKGLGSQWRGAPPPAPEPKG